MDAIKSFFSKYSLVVHAVMAVWVFLAGAYATVPAFSAYVNGVASSIAHSAPWLAALFVGAIVPLIKYWKGLSDTGKVAVANEVQRKIANGTLRSSANYSGTTKLGALALCSVLVMGTVVGCTSADAQKAVASINATIPAVESAVSIAAGIVSTLDPAIALLVSGANTGIQAGLQALQGSCTAYLADPTSGTFASIVTVVDNLVNNGDSALLQAAHIKDSASQQKATAVLASVDALLHVIDGYISAAQPTSAVKARMAKRTAKLATLQAYYSATDKQTIQNAFGQPYGVVLGHAYALGM